MADLKELADQAAEELLKAIRDHAGKAGESSLLHLAQAYSIHRFHRGQHKAGGRERNRHGGVLGGVHGVSAGGPNVHNTTRIPQGGIVKGSRPACGPFIRPDDAGTESLSIVRTFLWLKTTAANPQLLADQVSQLLVQRLEAASVVLSSGPRIFDTSGVLRIPKLTGSSTVGFIGENELIPSDHDTTFDEVVLMPTDRKSIKVIERYSRELARQAVIGIDATLKNRLVKVVSDKIDTALLVGKGQATNEVRSSRSTAHRPGAPSPSHSGAPPHRAWLTTPPHRLCRPHCKVCRPSAPATPPSAGAPGPPTP